MSEEKELEMEEFNEAFKIIDKHIKELEIKEEKENIPDEKEEVLDPLMKEEQIITKQTSFYMNFFLTIFMSLLNPLLKKNNITEVSAEETKELTQALMGIISNKMLSTTGKI